MWIAVGIAILGGVGYVLVVKGIPWLESLDRYFHLGHL
jgi:preprotein translocase subunit Sss1